VRRSAQISETQRKSAAPPSDKVAKVKLNHPALSKRPGSHGNACGRLVKAASGEGGVPFQLDQLARPATACYDQRLNLGAQERQEQETQGNRDD
jgi:hypothetical protein